MNKGYFIVFEGPDGSGKTTVSQKVYEIMKQEGLDVILTREPGGSRIAEDIRNIILNPVNIEMDARTEVLLYAASRRQHLKEKILPAVKEGKIVLCDRFVDSSLAYQAYGRQIELTEVVAINEFAIEGYHPDLTIFLNVTAEIGLSRLSDRKSLDRLDQESLEFHQRVFSGYQTILANTELNYKIIDANQTVTEVVKESLRIIKEFLS